MTSEIRVNSLTNRSGLSTVSITDTGVVVAGIVTANGLDINGNVSIGGTLTYEDVTNVDSVGLITARSGVKFGASGTTVVGNSSGIGIGTNDPGNHKLHLYGATNSDLRLTATGDDIVNIFANSNRSSANDSLFAIKGEWNGTQVANIKINAGDDTTNKDDGYITFNTRESGAGSSAERLRIRSDGDVLIGTDAEDLESQLGSRRRLAVCDTTNGALLHLRGQSPAIFFDQSGGNVGKMYLDNVGFEIHSGTPGTEGTNVFNIDSNGYRSFSTQPYALLRKNGTTVNISADVTVEFDTTVTSEGGMTVNGSKSRITVPKAGKYVVTGSVAGSNTTVNIGDGWRLEVWRDGSSYSNAYLHPIQSVGTAVGEEYNLQTSLILPADANDYFELRLASVGAARVNMRYGYFCVYYLG